MTLSFSYLVRKAADIALSEKPWRDRYNGVIGWLVSRHWFAVFPMVMLVVGVASVWEGFVDYLTTGEVHQHWSRFVFMAGALSVAAILTLTKILDACLNLLARHMQVLRDKTPVEVQLD